MSISFTKSVKSTFIAEVQLKCLQFAENHWQFNQIYVLLLVNRECHKQINIPREIYHLHYSWVGSIKKSSKNKFSYHSACSTLIINIYYLGFCIRNHNQFPMLTDTENVCHTIPERCFTKLTNIKLQSTRQNARHHAVWQIQVAR